jgi:hypothetical protein
VTKTFINPPKYCDVCKNELKEVFFDAKTKFGPWANMCNDCFNEFGVGIGIGKGQKYQVTKEQDK